MKSQMKSFLIRLWKEEEGQDATEYALLITLISLAMVGAIKGLATAITNTIAGATAVLT